jgi:hypothetical protein
MTDRPRKARTAPCVYCGEIRPLTNEDVIPRWVRKRVFQTGSVTRRKGGADGRPVRTDQTLTLKVRNVCQSCNGGWMRILGERVMADAAEAMAGLHIALTPERSRALAAWATDRALMFELALAHERHAVHAPPASLRWLSDHRDDPEPPPGAQISLAILHDAVSLPAWHSVGSFYPLELEQTEGNSDGSLAAFSIGHVVFLVFLQHFRESDHLTPDGRALCRFEFPSRYGGYLVPLWPDPDPLTVWPPRFALTIGDLHGFAEWTDIKVTRPVLPRQQTPRHAAPHSEPNG